SGVLGRDGSVVLDREVPVPLIEEGVLEDVIGLRKRSVDVAETERHDLVDVAVVAVAVNRGTRAREAVFRRRVGRQRLVDDVDEGEGFESRELVARDDSRDPDARGANALRPTA